MKGVAYALAGGTVSALLVAVVTSSPDTPQFTDEELRAAVESSGKDGVAAPAGRDCVTGSVEGLDDDQVKNARAIITASTRAGVGARGAEIGVATALVEGVHLRGETRGGTPGLRNVAYGHASSIGIFQELAGGGSGFQLTDAQRMDVAGAAGRFYAKLKRVPGWESMDQGDAAQAVQRSAHPDRYQRQMPRAKSIVAALTGASAECVPSRPSAEATGVVRDVIGWASAQKGKPYIFGGNGPGGYDCSSLTQQAWARAGVKLPRTAQTQRDWLARGNGQQVQLGQERPGDLVFWDSYLGPGKIGHVVMVKDTANRTTIEAHRTCRSGMKGPGIDCGIGEFSYDQKNKRNIFEIWRPAQ